MLQATERNQADLTSESVIDATSMPGDGQADFGAEAEDDGSLYENQVSLEPSTLSFDFRDKDSRVSKDASSSMTHLSPKVLAVQNTLSSSTMSDDAGSVLVSEPDKSTLIVEQAEQSSLSIVVEENNPENAETGVKMEVMVEETIKSVKHAGVGENDADHLSSRLQDGNDVGVMGDKTEEGKFSYHYLIGF